jgi:hypothetical protein
LSADDIRRTGDEFGDLFAVRKRCDQPGWTTHNVLRNRIMDWPSIAILSTGAVISIALSAVVYLLKQRCVVSLETAQRAILDELQKSQLDVDSANVVPVSNRGPFPLFDIDIGGTITKGIFVDPDSTLYYQVVAQDRAGKTSRWHAKIHSTFQHIRRVQVLPVEP